MNLDHQIILKLNPQIHVNALILESHQIIYRIILQNKDNSKLSLITLVRYLSEQKLLYKVGGITRILALINQALIFQKTSVKDITLENYAIIINNKYTRRLIIEWAGHIISLSQSSSIKLDLIFQQINKYIDKFALLTKESNTFGLSTTLKDLISNLYLKSYIDTTSYSTGIKCGLTKLDKLTQGFQPSDLIIIAGRPGMGKTSVALNITNYVLKNSKQGVILFSFEMSKRQILYRLISIQCKIAMHQLRSGCIDNYDLKNIKFNCQALAKSSLYIDDNPNTTIFELYLKTKKFAEVHSINLMIIDYLQLIQNSTSQFNNRVQELSSITRVLKILAREIHVPLIVLSQLNRNTENRSNKKPLLSDLRESGCFSHTTYLIYKQQWLKIGNILVHFIFYIRNMNTQFYLNTNYLVKQLCQGLQYLYTLKFWKNNFLNITNNHKIFTFSGWKIEESLFFFDTVMSTVDYLHSQLLSIELLRHELTYDITAHKLLNFQSTKTIIHNSIEQDADLVLLLYRDDYYIANNTNTNNSAEIIIAKHRNGPTGSFELHFDALHTTFTN